jgi:hypothetical protein
LEEIQPNTLQSLRNTNKNPISSKARTHTQTGFPTIKHITPQPSTPIERAGSDIWVGIGKLEDIEWNINKYM